MDFDAVWERVQKITEWKTQSDLANGLGIKQGSVGGAKKRGTFPIEWAFKIAQSYNASTDWLLSGEGSMRRDQRGSGGMNDSIANSDQGEYALVPRYNVEVSAGGGAFVDENEKALESMAFRCEWLKRMGLVATQLAVVTAKGDSMVPTIKEGDVLLIDLRPELRKLENLYDGIYVFRIDHQVLAKRLSRAPDGGMHVKSINPEYESFYITPDQIVDEHVNIVGRVVWRGGKM